MIRTYDRNGDLVRSKELTTTRPAAIQALATLTSEARADLGYLYSSSTSGQIMRTPIARAQRFVGVGVWDEKTRSTREYKF